MGFCWAIYVTILSMYVTKHCRHASRFFQVPEQSNAIKCAILRTKSINQTPATQVSITCKGSLEEADRLLLGFFCLSNRIFRSRICSHTKAMTRPFVYLYLRVGGFPFQNFPRCFKAFAVKHHILGSNCNCQWQFDVLNVFWDFQGGWMACKG